MAFKAPSGRMAHPKLPEFYVRCRAEHAGQEIVIWIERIVLEELDPAADEMYFVADLTRRYKLHFDGPVGLALAP